MTLSIITINFNNANGLRKTIESIVNQTSKEFEYIIVDGFSTDGSVEIIRSFESFKGFSITWISEKDKGIYDAMNKGIQMASGEYVQFVNSGDSLVGKDVTDRMINQLKVKSEELRVGSKELEVDILYGNMLKRVGGKVICDKGFEGRVPTMLDFYTGTLNHSPVYIRRSLFKLYGLYDDTLRYVSDWKWYVKVILLGDVKPLYVDIDVVDFDMSGVSTTNWEKTLKEKRIEMAKLFPESILIDYDNWAFGIDQLTRLKRHTWAYRLVYLLDRMLFKYEKMVSK